MNDRLSRQLAFLAEADRLKHVLRMTATIGGERRENSAEHSWHFALAAFILAEHAKEPVDILKVLKIGLIHDLVEIDAGDSFVYSAEAMDGKEEREKAAAERIFGMLPEGQAVELRTLWDEFEAQNTPEAKFAGAVDRLCGMMPNYHNGGGTWKAHGVSAARVKERNAPMADGAPALWDAASGWIAEAVAKGWIAEN